MTICAWFDTFRRARAGRTAADSSRRAKAARVPIFAAFLMFRAAMRNAVLALVLGTALWSVAGWFAHPREIWDVPAFWPVWGLAILFAGGLGLSRDSRPLRDTGLLFLPILGVLTISALLTGRGASLLPLGLVAVAVLALPGLGLSRLAQRLTASRH